MKKVLAVFFSGAALSAAASFVLVHGRAQASEGYVIERDAEVAKQEGGPHRGAGRTTGYNFFGKAPGMKLAFRKRVLHPGSSIGYHLQETNEVYYVLGGRGTMNINGREVPVGPGDAVLTRKGSSHGLVQAGAEDLTIIIAYDK
ncbi:MAG TPA: cupin domain-containing protein [Pyrinomonadaceae bacterium]|nr:cupin domain-containing protein [Pyrinomonadaceae bacterium]